MSDESQMDWNCRACGSVWAPEYLECSVCLLEETRVALEKEQELQRVTANTVTQQNELLNMHSERIERLVEDRAAWISTAKGAASDVMAMAKALREIHWFMGDERVPDEIRDSVCKRCDTALKIAGDSG